jgi:ketosteroid isomerase-like protein
VYTPSDVQKESGHHALKAEIETYFTPQEERSIMKRNIWILIWALMSLVVVSGVALGQAKGSSKKLNKTQGDFAEIDRKWLAAEKNGDFDYCEKFFADSYVLVMPDGQALTKRQWLDLLEGPDHPTLEVLQPDQVRARLFGNVAILTDHTTIKGHDSKGNSLDGEYRVFRVLLKQNGEWKAGGVSMNKLEK